MLRRFILRCLLCLAGGVVTTVVIALACAWWRPWPRDWLPLFAVDSRGETWMGFGEDGFGWSTRTLYGAEGVTEIGLAGAEDLPDWVETPGAGLLEERAVEAMAAGWPLGCLVASRSGIGHMDPPPGGAWHTGLGPQWVEWNEWRGVAHVQNGRLTALIPSSAAPGLGEILPGRVFPLRFAGNVIFWTVVWLLPLVAGGLRRTARRRRGRCAACDYDLRGDFGHGCPECGWGRSREG